MIRSLQQLLSQRDSRFIFLSRGTSRHPVLKVRQRKQQHRKPIANHHRTLSTIFCLKRRPLINLFQDTRPLETRHQPLRLYRAHLHPSPAFPSRYGVRNQEECYIGFLLLHFHAPPPWPHGPAGGGRERHMPRTTHAPIIHHHTLSMQQFWQQQQQHPTPAYTWRIPHHPRTRIKGFEVQFACIPT